MVNGVFKKRKVRLCVMGNQQDNGVHFQLGELYTPVMKVVEVRLFVALAAKHRLNLFKSDTKQAFLNGDMGDEKIYIRPPDWWPEKVETLDEYKMAVSKFLKPKKVPMQPGVMLEQEDCPETPDPVKQKVHRSFVA